MTTNSTALSSRLKSLIPESALANVSPPTTALGGVSAPTGKMGAQQYLYGPDGIKSLIRKLFAAHGPTFKYDQQADRLYVCTPKTANALFDDLTNRRVLISRSTASGRAIENASRVVIAQQLTIETYDVFVERVKDLISDQFAKSALLTRATLTFKNNKDAQRLYMYIKADRHSLDQLNAIEKFANTVGNCTIHQVLSGAYALTLRFDYATSMAIEAPAAVAQPPAPPQVTTVQKDAQAVFADADAEYNKKLQNYTDLQAHVEQLRGKVPENVLSAMLTSLKGAEPKEPPKPVLRWQVAGSEVLVTNKLGEKDLNTYYALLTAAGAEMLPQHVGSGLHVTLKGISIHQRDTVYKDVAVTLFLDRSAKGQMYAVIRDAKGLHQHVLLKQFNRRR